MAAYDQFVLFGDSLFQHSSSQERGFSLASALQAEYIRRLDVVNRGFSGYNTDQAVQVLPQIIPYPEHARMRFMTVFFGANDACLEGVTGGQHVPLERFEKNLRSIVDYPSDHGQDTRLILVTTPPVNEYACEENDRSKGIPEPRRSAEHTKLYADVVRKVARERKIPVVDLWECFMKHAGWQESDKELAGSKKLAPNPFLRMLLHDGLHFTNIAYTLFFQELMRVINQTWPDQMPEQLPFVFPIWNDPGAWTIP